MKLLEKDVFFFTTFGGEALSLAAAKATMQVLERNNVPLHLASIGSRIKRGLNQIISDLGMDYVNCMGFDCRTIVTFNSSAGNPLEMKSLVQQELIKRGILWGGFHNLSFSHSEEDAVYLLNSYKEVLPILKTAVEEKNILKHLHGEVVEPVFRKTSNFNLKPKVKLV
jgi:glutamate-1-semialdehyde 2,1-aminomutase